MTHIEDVTEREYSKASCQVKKALSPEIEQNSHPSMVFKVIELCVLLNRTKSGWEVVRANLSDRNDLFPIGFRRRLRNRVQVIVLDKSNGNWCFYSARRKVDLTFKSTRQLMASTYPKYVGREYN